MAITTVLFDLDGTLLPMDQDVFIKTYFGALAKRLAPHGSDPEQLVKAVWKGTGVMMGNDGSKTNEEAFWDFFAGIYGEKSREDIVYFDEFYRTDFSLARQVCGFNPLAAEIVRGLKARGVRVALATNPLFPEIATRQRAEWAGVSLDDFEVYTTYESCRYSKPRLEYYKGVLASMNVTPEECLMVGNDVEDDMVVEQLGMKVFLLTDTLINKSGEDISRFPNGDFNALNEYLDTILRK